jgi:hypothetical protein
MYRFCNLTTSLIFAVHVVLGCTVHHVYGHAEACDAHAAVHEGHDCHDAHDGQPNPTDESDQPTPPCQHLDCSFVKAESVQVEQGGPQSDWTLGTHFQPEIKTPQSCCPAFDSGLTRDLSSAAPLYVWHCALII